MKNTLFDQLNQILTNTLEYIELLNSLAQTAFDITIKEKLNKWALTKEKHSEELIKIISKLGGNIESTGGLTDQAALSWIATPVPERNNRVAILKLLIKAESNALETYREILKRNDIDGVLQKELHTHLQETEANLKYFMTVKRILRKG